MKPSKPQIEAAMKEVESKTQMLQERSFWERVAIQALHANILNPPQIDLHNFADRTAQIADEMLDRWKQRWPLGSRGQS